MTFGACGAISGRVFAAVHCGLSVDFLATTVMTSGGGGGGGSLASITAVEDEDVKCAAEDNVLVAVTF